jgi:hypothetical protein
MGFTKNVIAITVFFLVLAGLIWKGLASIGNDAARAVTTAAPFPAPPQTLGQGSGPRCSHSSKGARWSSCELRYVTGQWSL